MGSDAQARIAQLEQENEALRAALADAERRLHARQGDAGDEAAFRQALDRAVGQANRHGTPSALAIMCLEGLEDIRRSGGADAAERPASDGASVLSPPVRRVVSVMAQAAIPACMTARTTPSPGSISPWFDEFRLIAQECAESFARALKDTM
jgi:hypothetical protein